MKGLNTDDTITSGQSRSGEFLLSKNGEAIFIENFPFSTKTIKQKSFCFLICNRLYKEGNAKNQENFSQKIV